MKRYEYDVLNSTATNDEFDIDNLLSDNSTPQFQYRNQKKIKYSKGNQGRREKDALSLVIIASLTTWLVETLRCGDDAAQYSANRTQ